MKLQQIGGALSLFLAGTYIFGMVFFMGVLTPPPDLSPQESLGFFLDNSDSFFLGYLVIGFLFGFAIIGLSQSLHQKLSTVSPQASQYAYVLGVIWGITLLITSAILTTQLSSIPEYYAVDPQQALTIYRSARITEDALGGGIEIFGGVWVLVISIIGLKHHIFSKWLNLLGLFVAVAGILSLFSVLSVAEGNPLFSVITMIFGLGQIPWFIALGISMIKQANQNNADAHSAELSTPA